MQHSLLAIATCGMRNSEALTAKPLKSRLHALDRNRRPALQPPSSPPPPTSLLARGVHDGEPPGQIRQTLALSAVQIKSVYGFWFGPLPLSLGWIAFCHGRVRACVSESSALATAANAKARVARGPSKASAVKLVTRSSFAGAIARWPSKSLALRVKM